MNILVINAGSSSLKYQLIDMSTESVMAKGICERIGIDGHIKHQPQIEGRDTYEADLSLPTHAEAISVVLDKLMSAQYGVIKDASEIQAVGHRVVHGGEEFSSSYIITDEIMSAIEACVPLAPLHNPANITGITACKAVMGDIPNVAVFDTAFHQTMPPSAFTYAIPYKYYEEYKIRRYGFHGTSHKYVSQRAAEILGKPIEELKLISCHMGNGSSICAISGGKSVDTSMGFTPISGLPMGTRCGDLDVSIIEYLMENELFNVQELLNILNKESGVLGISGISSDFRDLDTAAENGDPRAQLALDVFHNAVSKTVGSYAAVMDGVDAIIFTAGIGENSPKTRRLVCKNLSYLGTTLDDNKNNVRGKEAIISTDDSKKKILVIPTNEELVIARDTLALVK